MEPTGEPGKSGSSRHPNPVVFFVCATMMGFLCMERSNAQPPGTTYYVSARGDDRYDGLSPSTSWQSVARVNDAVLRAGDSVLFKGGDTFLGPLVFVGSNTGGQQKVFSNASLPVTVGGYGGACNVQAGAVAGCPILSATGTIANGIVINNVSGVVVRDWLLMGADPLRQDEGVYLRNNDATGAVYEKVTVTNVSVTGFRFGVLVQGVTNNAGWRNFAISNNRIFGSIGTEDNGILVQGPRPGSPGKMTNFDCLIEGNLVEGISGRAGAPPGTSGNGILIKETDGCIDQFNIVRNGGRNTNSCGGPVGNWAYDATNIRLRFNETYGMAPDTWVRGCDWGGFHLDGYVSNSVIEYSYAHDNWGAGFGLWVTRSDAWHDNTVRYNIAENNGGTSSAQFFGGILITNNNSSLVGTYIYNNTIYSNSTSPSTTILAVQGNLGGDCVVANNILYKSSDNPLFINTGVATTASCVIVGNDYFGPSPSAFRVKWNGFTYSSLTAFRAGAGQELAVGNSVGSTLNPRISLPGQAHNCEGVSTSSRACLAWYQLQTGSSMVGVGLDLKRLYDINVGTRDYYGNQIPHNTGTGFNIGADGGEHL